MVEAGSLGLELGEDVGGNVGTDVGLREGWLVGNTVGLLEGGLEGELLGECVGVDADGGSTQLLVPQRQMSGNSLLTFWHAPASL